MLAYVFWHAPAPDVDRTGYEAALIAFHETLNAGAVDGFAGSAAHRVSGAPWLHGLAVYEDWYFIDGFAALGRLEAGALDARSVATHDGVAALAARGSAGLYGLARGDHHDGTGDAVWFPKPPGMTYGELYRQLGGRAPLWQRKLVLGPTPEFCILDGGTCPAGGIAVRRSATLFTSVAG